MDPDGDGVGCSPSPRPYLPHPAPPRPRAPPPPVPPDRPAAAASPSTYPRDPPARGLRSKSCGPVVAPPRHLARSRRYRAAIRLPMARRRGTGEGQNASTERAALGQRAPSPATPAGHHHDRPSLPRSAGARSRPAGVASGRLGSAGQLVLLRHPPATPSRPGHAAARGARVARHRQQRSAGRAAAAHGGGLQPQPPRGSGPSRSAPPDCLGGG